jgi:hypothetical protein
VVVVEHHKIQADVMAVLVAVQAHLLREAREILVGIIHQKVAMELLTQAKAVALVVGLVALVQMQTVKQDVMAALGQHQVFLVFR